MTKIVQRFLTLVMGAIWVWRLTQYVDHPGIDTRSNFEWACFWLVACVLWDIWRGHWR